MMFEKTHLRTLRVTFTSAMVSGLGRGKTVITALA
jgi:hypothetical protein